MANFSEALMAKVPEKARVLVADPPWKFDDSLPGTTRGAVSNYDLMTTNDIIRMPLPKFEDGAILFLWRVASMQQEALDVLRAWGFKTKTELVWLKRTKTNDKEHFGMGRYLRAAHEVCLIATRGRFQVADKGIRSVFAFEAPVGEHSEKPDAFYQLVETLCGKGPYVELFARKARPGWHCLGNELPDGYVYTPPSATPPASMVDVTTVDVTTPVAVLPPQVAAPVSAIQPNPIDPMAVPDPDAVMDSLTAAIAAPIPPIAEDAIPTPDQARTENRRLLKLIESNIKQRTALVRLAYDKGMLPRTVTNYAWEELCDRIGKLDYISPWLRTTIPAILADASIAGFDLKPEAPPIVPVPPVMPRSELPAALAAVASVPSDVVMGAVAMSAATHMLSPTPVVSEAATITVGQEQPHRFDLLAWRSIATTATVEESDDTIHIDLASIPWNKHESTTVTGTIPMSLRPDEALPSGAIPTHVIEELRGHPATTPEDKRRRLILLAVREGLLPDGLTFDEAWIRFQYAIPKGWVQARETALATVFATAASKVACNACDKGIPFGPEHDFKHMCVPASAGNGNNSASPSPTTAVSKAAGEKTGRICGVCKQPGHNARTCPQKAAATS
jgi:N6-adenosine-specific RNA methylase IME4